VNVSAVARIWQAAGVSVIPILDNQTKRPAVRWSPYQAVAPSLDDLTEWWGNGKPWGLALICGAVSGNLEMTETEGRAMVSDKLQDVINRMDELGVGHIWDLLYGPEGFTETSPSGGLHFLYRISDHEVPGNTKIASNEDGLCLAETRGHGGYVITAPTPGICHPSGEPWTLREGRYGILPTLTWQERCRFHEALRLALDESPKPPSVASADMSNQLVLAPASLPSTGTTAPGLPAGTSPGDDFEARTEWADILEPHGWSLESRHANGELHWTRPGKNRREGASATTGRASDRDRLYVFSTSTQFASETAYTKFGAYTLLNHGGDFSAAAGELFRRGFGSRSQPGALESFVPDESDPYTKDDMGNGKRLHGWVGDTYHWVTEEKRYYRWDGRVWTHDYSGALAREVVAMTDAMLAKGGDIAKWASRSRSTGKVKAAQESMQWVDGVTIRREEFDPYRNLLNLRNGVLNLVTGKFQAHEVGLMMTRMFGASYDPDAQCPRFREFMAAALPDEQLRGYVQRALGYTLLGDVDQRSIFWIYGPPGTGKSTLTEAMEEIFGDYGSTAASGTFRAKGREGGPTNDLHGLRGRRFVTTSETAESTSFDEDLLKRLSGRDRVTSRELYQENVEWVPECVLWMATNNAPKFNSDDEAIWRRTKLIPFLTTFTTADEVSDYARNVLAPERDGILNWLLEGLREYLTDGLGEPPQVQELAHEQRVLSDSVARFIDERVMDGVLVLEPEERIRTTELYAMYLEWTRSVGERPLTSRRLINRLRSNFPQVEHTKIGGNFFWLGLGRLSGAGIFGLISPST
jgi:putative DNA primase/helicase